MVRQLPYFIATLVVTASKVVDTALEIKATATSGSTVRNYTLTLQKGETTAFEYIGNFNPAAL